MARRKVIMKELRPVNFSKEQRILRRFFPEGKGKLDGILEQGLLGPDAPETREFGKFESKWIMGGIYCILTYDVHLFESGKKKERSQGHCVLGWDTHASEYRMLRAANLGVLFQLRGHLEGNSLAFTSDETMIKGKQTRVRYTFIRKRPRETIWIAKLKTRGSPWKMVGRDILTYS